MQSCLLLSNIPPICSDATLHSLFSSHLPLQSLVVPRHAGLTRGFACLRLRYSTLLHLKQYAALVRSLTFPNLAFNRFKVQEDPGGRRFASRLRALYAREKIPACTTACRDRQRAARHLHTLKAPSAPTRASHPVVQDHRRKDFRRNPTAEHDQWPAVPRKKNRRVSLSEDSSQFSELQRHLSYRNLKTSAIDKSRGSGQRLPASHYEGRHETAALKGGFRHTRRKPTLPKSLPKFKCDAYELSTVHGRERQGSSRTEENAPLRKRTTGGLLETSVTERNLKERALEQHGGVLKKGLRKRVRTHELDRVLEQVRLKRRKKEAKQARLSEGRHAGAESPAHTKLRATAAVIEIRGESGSKGAATTDGDRCVELQHLPEGKCVACSDSRIHGTGLFAMEQIAAGEFVIEYGGTRGPKGCEDRLQEEYERRGIKDSYIFQLPDGSVIDGTMSKSLSRYINHSCDANVSAYCVEYRGTSRVMFYAMRSIAPGEEITCDYRFELEDESKKILCLCGARICQGYLNYDPFGLRNDNENSVAL